MSWVRGQSGPPPFPQPENILCVNTTGHMVKIIDFGLARRYPLGGWGGQGKPLRCAGDRRRVEWRVWGMGWGLCSELLLSPPGIIPTRS